MRSTTIRSNNKRIALFNLLKNCPMTTWQMVEASGMKEPVVQNFLTEHLREKRIEPVGTGERKPGVFKGYKPTTYGAVDGAEVLLLNGQGARRGRPDVGDDEDLPHRLMHQRLPCALEDAWFHKERERFFTF